MNSEILMAYATRKGSTREIADAVAAALRENGIGVDVERLRDVRSIHPYQAVIIGAPLYMFHWHKDALNFLTKHRESLLQKPVAVFASGPFGDTQESAWIEIREKFEKELGNFPWLQPKAVEIFGGKYDPDQWGFPYSLFLKNMPASDLRDWTKIRAWARQLAASLLETQK